jgi:hypothetical protein
LVCTPRGGYLSGIGDTKSGEMTTMDATVKRGRVKKLLGGTLAYLVCESSFASVLLRACGAGAGLAAVHGLERSGRTLSGIALGLLVWGAWFLGGSRLADTKRKALVSFVATLAVCIAVMFQVQSALVDHLVDGMDGKQRREAVFLAVAASGIGHGDMQLRGLELGADELRSPGGMTLLSLIPLLASSIPDVEQQGRDALRQAIRNRVVGCAPGEACIGSFDRFANEAWRPMLKRVADAYAGYAKADDEWGKAIGRNLGAAQQKAWDGYQKEMRYRNHLDIARLTPNVAAEVRSEIQAMGIPVSDTWRPDDANGFYDAIAKSVHADADKQFDDGMRQQLGDTLPHGLKAEQFFQQPVIQKRLLDASGLGKWMDSLPYATTEGAMRKLYDSLVEKVVDQQVSALVLPPEEYAPGGSHADEGREAAERLWVPPLALAFSLLGSLGHAVKTLVLALMLKGVRKPVALGVAAAVMVAAWIAGTTAEGTITGTQEWHALEAQVAATHSPVVAKGLHWVVEAETVAWPVSDAIRKTVLLGYGFGYDG